VLLKCEVPLDHYGVGNAKTVEQLLSEVSQGESVLTIDQHNRLKRIVNVVGVDVLYETPEGEVYVLKENRQEFKDGRVRRRNVASSLGEKMKPLESPDQAAKRALWEELGIQTSEALYEIGHTKKTSFSETYPGIESTYTLNAFVAKIPENEFDPKGYVEYQGDKTNYYRWELLETKN
jgi:hypothetical protein